MDLIDSLSFRRNLDLPVYSASRKIKFLRKSLGFE